jgi:hypothetical protein
MRARLLLPLVLLVLSGPAVAGNSPVWAFFSKILKEAGMTYTRPPGFEELPPKANPVFVYHYRVKNAQTGIEIRYIVAPIRRIKVDYHDPHASAPEPNHVFSLVFPSLLSKLSVDGTYREKEYPPLEALRLFNADWAGAGVFTPNPEFAPFAHGFVVAMHKNDHADAYEIFLANDLERLKAAVIKYQTALRYASSALDHEGKEQAGGGEVDHVKGDQ